MLKGAQDRAMVCILKRKFGVKDVFKQGLTAFGSVTAFVD